MALTFEVPVNLGGGRCSCVAERERLVDARVAAEVVARALLSVRDDIAGDNPLEPGLSQAAEGGMLLLRLRGDKADWSTTVRPVIEEG